MVKPGTMLVSSSVKGEHLPKISDPIKHLLGCHCSWDVALSGAHLDKHQTRAFEGLCFGGFKSSVHSFRFECLFCCLDSLSS